MPEPSPEQFRTVLARLVVGGATDIEDSCFWCNAWMPERFGHPTAPDGIEPHRPDCAYTEALALITEEDLAPWRPQRLVTSVVRYV